MARYTRQSASLTSSVFTLATLLLLGTFASFTTAETSIWTVHLPYEPAPPRDKGPPIAKDAIRDPSKLKYMIAGIVGGYVGGVVLMTIFVFTMGRRWRKAAQLPDGDEKPKEMVKPNRWLQENSPAGHSLRPGQKWGGFGTSPNTKTSPSAQSVSVFDDNVLQSDKERRDQEMERIYAQVMASDTKAPRSISAKSDDATSPRSPNGHTRNLSSSSRSFSQRMPPQRQQSAPTSPLTPTSPVPAVYPPNAPMPSDPNAPLRSPLESNANPHYSGSSSLAHNGPGPTSPQSFHSSHSFSRPFNSHSRQGSAGSWQGSRNAANTRPPPPTANAPQTSSSAKGRDKNGSRAKHTRTLKNLTISAPMKSSESVQDEARTPLSPRNYPDQGQQPSPPAMRGRPITPIQDSDDTDDADVIEAYGYEGLEGRRPLPRAAPQRGRRADPYQTRGAQGIGIAIEDPEQQQQQQQRNSGPPPLPPAPKGYAPPPAPLSTQNLGPYQNPPSGAPGSATRSPAGGSTNKLPFRNYNHSNASMSSTAVSAAPGPANPTSPGAPTPTKTTLLSPAAARRPGESQHPLGFTSIQSPGRGGMRTGGLGSMNTPAPQTPYSPYMPFSPVTPVTPRLVSKAERKQRHKEEGRRMATAEEDGVQDDEEMWGEVDYK
ncbi:MAG: hypothetical protein M1831_003609 [Alyxoria varia]|nr:MAG: hypothetical protein M1831_003609 [Alyxoria varia]